MAEKAVGATKNSTVVELHNKEYDLLKLTKGSLITLCLKIDTERLKALSYGADQEARTIVLEQLVKERQEFIQQLQSENECIERDRKDFSSNYDAISSRYSTQLEMSRADKLEVELLKTRLRIAESLLSKDAMAEYESLIGHKNSYLISRHLMMPTRDLARSVTPDMIASGKKEIIEKMNDPAK